MPYKATFGQDFLKKLMKQNSNTPFYRPQDAAKPRTLGVQNTTAPVVDTVKVNEIVTRYQDAVARAKGLQDKIIDNIEKSKNSPKRDYTADINAAQKSYDDAERALFSAQQYNYDMRPDDMKKLQADADQAYANLRDLQAKQPSGTAFGYGTEQALLNIRQSGRNIKSGAMVQVGSYSEDIANVINGQEPKTAVGVISKGIIDSFGGADKYKQSIPQMMTSLEQKEKAGGLNPIDQLQLFYLRDFTSGGAESKKQIRQNYAENQADAAEVERLYTNVPADARKTAGNIGGAIGSGLSAMAAYAVNPALGGAYTFMSSSGQSAEQAVNEGATLNQAAMNANLTGVANVAIEQMFAGLPFVGGAIKAGDKAAEKISNPYLQAGVKRLVDAFGEGTEEVATTTLQPFINRATYDPDAPLPTFDELSQAFGGGFAASVFLGMPVDIINMNAYKAGKVKFTDLTEEQRISLVDPRNAEQTNTILGTKFTGNETPMEIRGQLYKLNAQTQQKDAGNDPIKYGIIPYDEREIQNLTGTGQLVDGVNADFNNFVDEAAKTKTLHKEIYIGKLSPEISNKINDELIPGEKPVDDYSVVFMTDTIDKILKQDTGHANAETEISRGNLPVTSEIIKNNAKNVLFNPDVILRSQKDYNGKPTFIFSKKINGWAVFVEVVSDKGKKLWPQTIYIQKRAPRTPSNAGIATGPTAPDVQNESVTGPFNDIILQNKEDSNTEPIEPIKSGTVDVIKSEPEPVYRARQDAINEIRKAAKTGTVENEEIANLLKADSEVARYERGLAAYEQKQDYASREERLKYINDWRRMLAESEAKADKAASVAAEKTKGDERLQKSINHYRDMIERGARRRSENAERQALLKVVRQLNKMSRKTTPENQDKIKELISDLDTTAVSMSEKGELNLKEIKRQYDELRLAPDFIENKIMSSKISRLDHMQIAEMTIDDVRDLTDVLRGLKHEIQTAKREIGVEKAREMSELARQGIKEIRDSKGRGSSAIGALYNTDAISPMRKFAELGGWRDGSVMERMGQQLNDGQRKMYDLQMRATKSFDEFVKNNKKLIEKWSGKSAEMIDTGIFDGNYHLRITPAQRISLYLHSLNDDNMRHVSNGGVTIPDETLYKKGDVAEAYARGQTVKLSKTEVKSITDKMTAKEKEFAGLAYEFFNKTSKNAINKTSLEVLGYELATVDNYIPISTNRAFVHGEFESLLHDGTIEGMGMLKERKQAANPVVLEDITSVLLRQIDNVSKYYGLATPIRNFNRVYNASTVDFKDSVKNAVSQKFGKNATAYIEKLMVDLQGGRKVQNTSLDRLRGNFAQAVLGFNVGSTLKQIASLPTAATTLGWKSIAKSLKPGFTQDNIIDEYTPLMWLRRQGLSTTELGDVSTRKGWADKMPLLMKWTQAMDIFTTKRVWKAAEVYVSDNYASLKKGSSEYYKEVANWFNKTVEETQSNYTVMQRPQILRSENQMIKAVTMFQTDRMQLFNVLYGSVGRLQRAKSDFKTNPTPENKAAVNKYGQQMARSITGAIGSAATVAAITSAVAMLLGRTWDYEDDDGNVTTKSFMDGLMNNFASSIAGTIFLGSEMYGVIESTITGKTWYEIEAPNLGMVNDIANNVIKFFQKIGEVTSGISEISAENGDVIEYLRSKPYEILKPARELGKSIAQVFGFPASNIEKYITGIAGQLSPEFRSWYENVFTPQDLKDLKSAKDKDFAAIFGQVASNRMPDVLNNKDVLNEMKRIYKENKGVDGINSLFLGDVPSKISNNKVEYILTAKEQLEYGKDQREGVAAAIENLMKLDSYKNMTDEHKIYAVSVINDAAQEVAKANLLKKRGAEYKPSNALEVMEAGGDLSSYAAYKAFTKAYGDDDSVKLDEKARTMLDMDLSENDLIAIYSSDIENDSTDPEKSIKYAVQNGADASTYIGYKAQRFEGEGATERKNRWLLDNSSAQKEIMTLYQIFMQDKDIKEENSIQYAQSVGVRPESFVERQIQVAQAEGDKEGSAEIYLVNGQAVNKYGETTVDGTKKREAMKTLLNSNYTETEKQYFYQKEYGQDDKYVWAMVAGIPVDQYAQMKRDEWDIHGKKDSSGKTVSGSKKEAYVAYVKSLKLNSAQRAILLLQNGYTLGVNNYKDIAQYISGLKLSTKEKLQLADSVGLVTSGNTILFKRKK